MTGRMYSAGVPIAIIVVIILLIIIVIIGPLLEPEFLGESDFQGQAVAPYGPVATGGTQGTYNGIMAFTNVDRSLIGQLLPTNFELSPRSTTRSPDLHPIVILFGDVTDGAILTSPTTTQPTGIHYSEMILAIPFVQLQNGSGNWHTYIVRMYLDNSAAVIGGVPYGYQKRLAWVEWKGTYARIWSTLSGSDYVEGTLRWGSIWYDGDEAFVELANFDDMVGILTTEILGHDGSKPICSQFEWNLDQTRIARAFTSYTMIQAFTPNMSSWPGLSPFENVRDGAVVLRGVRWRLAQSPIPCRF